MKRPTKEPPLPKGIVLDVHAVARDVFRDSEKAVRKRVERRSIPFRHDGGRIVFLREELQEFFRKLPGCSIDEALGNVAARVGDEEEDT